MKSSKRSLSKSIVAVSTGAVSLFVPKIINKMWKKTTGDNPPDINDPNIPLRKALILTSTTAITISILDLSARRIIGKISNKPQKLPKAN